MMLYSKKFELAMSELFQWEGGYVNDPQDPGGETKYGIAKRYNPEVDVKNLTKEQAKEIYWTKYWAPFEYHALPPLIAKKLFVASVLGGIKKPRVALQRAVRAASGYILKRDGVIGPRSILAIAGCDEKVLLAAFKSELAGDTRVRVALAPYKQKWLKGWENRNYSG